VQLFECVPNVSEGRDARFVELCAQAIASAGVSLAHVTSDADHHRSVFTFFGTRERVLGAALALARCASSGIDLRRHSGLHPRIGALDVLPFVPFGSATLEEAGALAREAGARIWRELRVPSYFYGAASQGRVRALPELRAGGFERLGIRTDAFDAGEVAHPSAGAIAIGARPPLVAFNLVLASEDPACGHAIVRRLRERDGGLRTLRALALVLANGQVQISCNLSDVAATPLHRVLALVRTFAAQAGTSVLTTEVIGLLPRRAVADLVAHAFGIEGNAMMTQ